MKMTKDQAAIYAEMEMDAATLEACLVDIRKGCARLEEAVQETLDIISRHNEKMKKFRAGIK